MLAGQLRGAEGQGGPTEGVFLAFFLSIIGLNPGYTLEEIAWGVSVSGAGDGGWGWEAVAMVQERLDNDSRIIPSSPPSSRLGIASSRKPVPVTQLDTFPLLSLLELS